MKKWTKESAAARLQADYISYLTLPGCGWTTVPVGGTHSQTEAQQLAAWMTEAAQALDPRIVVEVDEWMAHNPTTGEVFAAGRWAVGLHLPATSVDPDGPPTPPYKKEEP